VDDGFGGNGGGDDAGGFGGDDGFSGSGGGTDFGGFGGGSEGGGFLTFDDPTGFDDPFVTNSPTPSASA